MPALLKYPDVSNYQGGMSLRGAAAACILVTQGTDYSNPYLAWFLDSAARFNVFPFGYHFLEEGNGAAQARWYLSHSRLPCMLDIEPDEKLTSSPHMTDVLDFVTELRALGGTVHLAYLPRWYWEELGSPSLHVLTQAGLSLVSSDYTTYSAGGVGWEPYGGIKPVIWQFSSTYPLNGRRVDCNAWQGTLQQLKDLVEGSQKPASHDQQEDPEMNIAADEATKTLSWVQGSAKGITFSCGTGGAQTLSVTLYAPDSHAYKTVTGLVVDKGRTSLDFPAKDTYMAVVERQGAAHPAAPGDEWQQIWAHTYG